MLKKRIIPIELLVDGRLVKTQQFGPHRDVGDPVASSRVYSAQNADELVFLNIHRTDRGIEPLLPLLERVSEACFMPLALGGGIRSLKDAEILIRHGADKVVVNTEAHRDPVLVGEIASRFGSQAVVLSIDVRGSGPWAVWTNCGRDRATASLDEAIERGVKYGAGEILVTSIDRDGTMTGFDLPLLNYVCARCSIPVIAAGGAGHYDHLRAAFLETRVAAVAVGSLFNFGDSNPMRAKAYLTNHGIPFKLV